VKIPIYCKIDEIPIEEVKPYYNNPRINDATRHALVDAFAKIGFNQPIVIDHEGVIVKGHARYYAAKMSGYTKVPCIVSEATAEQNKADRISDNKIQEMTEWDLSTLQEELSEIKLHIAGIDVGVADLLGQLDQTAGDPASLEEPRKRMVDAICPKCGKDLEYNIDDLLALPNVKPEGEESHE
jgi:ParB-like chromosome segregation protein Spo0J